MKVETTIYHYDGTFEGFLCSCAEAYRRGGSPFFACSEPEGDLFSQVVRVASDEFLARKMAEWVAGKASPHVLRMAYHAFLSEAEGVGMLLWRYLETARREGEKVDSLLTHPHVMPVRRLAEKVRREAHRMKGFVRFQEVAGGFFYAGIRSDHFILPLVASHFADRFSDRSWIVHDSGRGQAILYDHIVGEWVLAGFRLAGSIPLAEREALFSGVWRRYFDDVAIGERQNLSLQRKKVPLRYRQMLTEF